MADNIRIRIEGLDKIQAGIKRFPDVIGSYMMQAGDQAAKLHVLKTPGVGLGKAGYPPETDANRPPTPYYQRHWGMIYKYGRGPKTSEFFGMQWYVAKRPPLSVEFGNRATYGKYLVGDEQARHMKRIGWKKLREAAEEKIPQITRVYQAWVNKCIRDLGL